MESPLPGDWINLLKSDFNLIELPFNEEKIKNMKPKIFKKLIKAKIKCAALKYLKEIQSEHSKIKLISYPKLEMQKYLSSKEFNNEQVNLLAALRSRMVDVKCNFRGKYYDLNCRFKCNEEETQQHMFNCVLF